MYVCVYVCLCTFISLSLFLCLSVCLSLSLSLYIYMCVCVCVSVCVCLCMSVCLCVCAHLSIRTYAYVCIGVCVCLWEREREVRFTQPQNIWYYLFYVSKNLKKCLFYKTFSSSLIVNCDNYYFTFELEEWMWVHIYWILDRDQVPICHLSNKSNQKTDKPKDF
jgi:hypothetical protein